MTQRKPKDKTSKKQRQPFDPHEADKAGDNNTADSHIIETIADPSSEDEAGSNSESSSCYSSESISEDDKEEEGDLHDKCISVLYSSYFSHHCNHKSIVLHIHKHFLSDGLYVTQTEAEDGKNEILMHMRRTQTQSENGTKYFRLPYKHFLQV